MDWYWIAIFGFLSFPAMCGIGYAIASYFNLFERVRSLEQKREWDSKKLEDLYNRVIFEIPKTMRDNGWKV